MSDSHHITLKKVTEYTRRELDEQINDPDSDLAKYSEKRQAKRKAQTERKQKKVEQDIDRNA